MTLLASFDWHFIWEHIPDFWDGLKATLKVAAIGIAGSLAIGVVLGAARAHRENFRAGFEAVPYRYREAGLALGFSRFKTFLNVTLPIGGRIALPSSINTYISVLKNTSLLTAIGFAELTNTAYSLESVSFKATEVYFALGVTYLLVVWTLSALIRFIEGRLALPEQA